MGVETPLSMPIDVVQSLPFFSNFCPTDLFFSFKRQSKCGGESVGENRKSSRGAVALPQPWSPRFFQGCKTWVSVTASGVKPTILHLPPLLIESLPRIVRALGFSNLFNAWHPVGPNLFGKTDVRPLHARVHRWCCCAWTSKFFAQQEVQLVILGAALAITLYNVIILEPRAVNALEEQQVCASGSPPTPYMYAAMFCTIIVVFFLRVNTASAGEYCQIQHFDGKHGQRH